MYLTQEQFATIKNYLQQQGWLKSASEGELVDHFCCHIETRMMEGSSFEEAFAETQVCWNEDEVQKMNSSNQKTSIMLKLMTLTTALLALLTFSPIDIPTEDRPTDLMLETCRIDPPSACPLHDQLQETSGFGERFHALTKKMAFHRGIDWKAPMGTPVHAAGDGVVLRAEKHDKYGLRIIIVHDEIYQTLYAHLSELHVSVGDTITAGQWIGDVGSTGWSTSPHLHYEVIKNGQAVDPKQYLP